MHAHTQTSSPGGHGRSMVPPCGFPPAFTFTAHGGFDTPVLAGMLDSLVRVSRRGKENHFVRAGHSRDDTPRYSPSEERLPSAAQAPATVPGPGHGQDATQRPKGRRESFEARHWFPSLPFQQFQALFNSLFKVLCIFPSRYLYAIGLPPIFSFRWNLPPTLSCNPKQLDSLMFASIEHQANGSLTLSAALFQGTWLGSF